MSAAARPGAGPPPRRSPIRLLAEIGVPAAVLSVALSGMTTAAEDASGGGLTRCPTIQDGLSRLSCYDAALKRAGQEPVARAAFPLVDLVDFKTNRTDLLTKPVQISGRLGIIGQYGALRSPDGIDNNPVWISVDRLKPERRKEIATLCARRCIATVRGRVGHVFSDIGVAAEAIEVETP
jgi:hypothetical protein